jgi:hypothetical protein
MKDPQSCASLTLQYARRTLSQLWSARIHACREIRDEYQRH